jgi:hypothetical protein
MPTRRPPGAPSRQRAGAPPRRCRFSRTHLGGTLRSPLGQVAACQRLLVAAKPTTGRAMHAECPADPVAESATTLRTGDPPTGVLAGQGSSQADADVRDSLAVMG